MCIRVLLSIFGCGMKVVVGSLIKALVQRVPESTWPAVRWKIAREIATLTSQLNLHVELATYLLPFSCGRCVGLSLDICYLSLYQWSDSPGADLIPRSDASGLAVADNGDLTDVSFTVGNIVDLIERTPSLDKNSDVVWACGLTRLLKQMITMPVVLRKRGASDVTRLDKVVQKLRNGQVRLDNMTAEVILFSLLRRRRLWGSSSMGLRIESVWPDWLSLAS